MSTRALPVFWLAVFLVGCEEEPPMAVGQLESDRIELIAETNEPITAIMALEGELVSPGSILVRQDTSRIQLRIAEAGANVTRLEAVLAEQIAGPRVETIAATEASLQEAKIERDFRERDLQRQVGLRESNLTSIESVDNAERLLATAEARIEFVAAQLAELNAGTRSEQIAQTHGSLLQVKSQIESMRFDQARHDITAPVAGVLDSLPYELGERPRVGDVVAVLLGGEQPFARIYIPEPQRAGISVGSKLDIHIDGIANPLSGTVRRIAADPAFTPYFALTERDRSRLSYVAEVTFPTQAARLPEGLPVQVYFD